MNFLDRIISWAGFACIALVAMVSPWLFAAWEMWYFWPFVALIFASVFFFSLGLLRTSAGGGEGETGNGSGGETGPWLKRLLVLSYGGFLVYGFVRFMQADVFMDAERSFLLYLTPFLLGMQIVFGFNKRQLRVLYVLIFVNLFLLGLYGVINDAGWKSTHVLWRAGYPQYVAEGRATGSYFCPDHFSGIMELAFCLAAGVMFARGERGWTKVVAGLVGLVALLGVLMSKSRGGGLALLAVGAVMLVIGFYQWPRAIRWYWRAILGGVAGLSLMAFCQYETTYMNRFKEHFGWNDQVKSKSAGERLAIVEKTLRASCRGQMYSAALRAWGEKPVWGVGPGMHQNLWPHYAASPDGNRELGAWPTYPNNEFHSYEVHSDWIQLLEEYGMVGFGLFLLPLLVVMAVLAAGFRRGAAACERGEGREAADGCYGALLSGALALAAMGVHSLGDFNLQMPATTWMLACILAIPMALVLRRESN